MTKIIGLINFFAFWGFVATKLVGHIFVDWSWWWLLVPIVPWLGHIVQQLGL